MNNLEKLDKVLENLTTLGAYQGAVPFRTHVGSEFIRATWLSDLHCGFGWHDLVIMSDRAESLGFRVNVVSSDNIKIGNVRKNQFSISFYQINQK